VRENTLLNLRRRALHSSLHRPPRGPSPVLRLPLLVLDQFSVVAVCRWAMHLDDELFFPVGLLVTIDAGLRRRAGCCCNSVAGRCRRFYFLGLHSAPITRSWPRRVAILPSAPIPRPAATLLSPARIACFWRRQQAYPRHTPTSEAIPSEVGVWKNRQAPAGAGAGAGADAGGGARVDAVAQTQSTSHWRPPGSANQWKQYLQKPGIQQNLP
jgi:hypothetical protein